MNRSGVEDRVWEMLAKAEGLEPSPRFVANVWSRIEARRASPAGWWRRWEWTAPPYASAPWAAVALAGLLTGFGLSQLERSASSPTGPTMSALAVFSAFPPLSVGAAFHDAGRHP